MLFALLSEMSENYICHNFCKVTAIIYSLQNITGLTRVPRFTRVGYSFRNGLQSFICRRFV